jgi:hypothetical protein
LLHTVAVEERDERKMSKAFGIAAGVLAICIVANVALAQQAGPSGSSTGPGGLPAAGNQQGSGNMTQEQFNKLQDYADMSRRMTKGDSKGKTLAQLIAEDKAAATALVAEMPLNCEVKDAILIAEGDLTLDGKAVKTKTYETACGNGMGYFLIALEGRKGLGSTCYGADALRAADVATGRTPGVVCTLAPNADLNKMSTELLAKAGKSCTVKNHRYVGKKGFTEFNEVVCSDNAGYVLAVALPGSTAPVSVTTCRESTAQGVPCKLSDGGAPVVNAQTFLDALSKNKVACDASTNSDIHAIGQDNKSKRYVIEFRCSQRPQGTVAYIPLADNKAPFEVLDCAAAAKHGVACTLTKRN